MSSEISSPDLLAPYDIIFSCAICQRTVTELYRRPQTDHGFSSEGARERVVTQLWLSECGHLSCTDHLEGGGVPFHPKGKRPTAQCPVCASEKDDTAPKLLFAIYGAHEGEYDKEIPKEYFEVPPAQMNTKNSFQYLSLIRFGGMMDKRCKEAKRAKRASEAKIQDLATSLDETRQEYTSLRTKAKGLEILEQKYEKYKRREPEIRHHLGNVAGLARENTMMKHQLKRLGFNVPQSQWSYGPKKPKAEPETQQESDELPQVRAMAPQLDSSSSERKRSRSSYQNGVSYDYIEEPIAQYESMPPPTMPQQRNASKQLAETYSGGNWRHSRLSDQRVAPAVRPPQPFDQYMMSGALPPRKRHVASTADQKMPSIANIQRAAGFHQQLPMRGRSEVSGGQLPTRDSAMGQAPIAEMFDPPSMRQPFVFPASDPPAHHQRTNYFPPANDSLTPLSKPMRSHAVQPPDVPVPKSRLNIPEDQSFDAYMQPPRQVLPPSEFAQSRQHQPHARLAPRMDRMRMDSDYENEPISQNLNELSFIQEPYTQSNKPLYTQQEPRQIWSRAMGYARAPTRPFQAVQKSYPTPRISASRSSVMQDVTNSSNQAATFRGMKGGAPQVPAYERGGAVGRTPLFPYQQHRGVYTANGRRSVRR